MDLRKVFGKKCHRFAQLFYQMILKRIAFDQIISIFIFNNYK